METPAASAVSGFPSPMSWPRVAAELLRRGYRFCDPDGFAVPVAGATVGILRERHEDEMAELEVTELEGDSRRLWLGKLTRQGGRWTLVAFGTRAAGELGPTLTRLAQAECAQLRVCVEEGSPRLERWLEV